MTAVDQRDTPAAGAADQESGAPASGKRGHGRLMMIACCVPMLAIAVLIAVSGAGFGFLIISVICTAMMALMMGAMSHGDGGRGGGPGGQERQ